MYCSYRRYSPTDTRVHPGTVNARPYHVTHAEIALHACVDWSSRSLAFFMEIKHIITGLTRDVRFELQQPVDSDLRILEGDGVSYRRNPFELNEKVTCCSFQRLLEGRHRRFPPSGGV